MFEVPKKECVNIWLCFRQLFHALDHVVVEDKAVGFRGLDDTVKYRARISAICSDREQPVLPAYTSGLMARSARLLSIDKCPSSI